MLLFCPGGESMGRKRAVLFDLGATLVTGPSSAPAAQVARMLDLPAGEERRVAEVLLCRNYPGPAEVCCALAGLVPGGQVREEEVCHLWVDQESAAVEIPGATEAVVRAKELGYAVGLVSDIWAPYYRAFLHACPEIASRVDFAALSFRVGKRKPAPQIFLAALEGLGVDSCHAIMVGDTYDRDILPAKKLGLRTIWVLCRPEREYRAAAAVLMENWPRPDRIVAHIGEVPGALAELTW